MLAARKIEKFRLQHQLLAFAFDPDDVVFWTLIQQPRLFFRRAYNGRIRSAGQNEACQW